MIRFNQNFRQQLKQIVDVHTWFLPCWSMLDTRSVRKHDFHQKVQEMLLAAAIIDMAFKYTMKLASEAHFSFSFRFSFSKKVIVAFALFATQFVSFRQTKRCKTQKFLIFFA